MNKVIKAITSSVEAKKTNPLEAIDKIAHSTVDATVTNTTNYVADVIDPSYKAVKNVLNIVNPMSYKRNGLKNIIKAPAGAITQGTTAFKNYILGVNSHIKNLYQKAVQDNARHIENATLEHIPHVGPFISKFLNATLAVPVLIPAAIDGLAHVVDAFANAGNNLTKLEGQELAPVRMRV